MRYLLPDIYRFMKKLLLNFTYIAASLLFINPSLFYAQSFPQLVNGDMEQWENVGSNNEEPIQWNSFMTGDCSLVIGCSNAKRKRIERSTDVRPGSTGQYSARIWSTSEFGNVANGNLTTGKIYMGSTTPSNSANHNKTISTDPAFRMPINEKPDSLVFWAKFIPKNNSTTDRARVRAVLHNNSNYQDPAGSLSSEVGNATINYLRTHNGSTYVWQRFAVAFDYSQGQATTPAYMLITFTTNQAAGGGTADDQVWIDDIQLIYNPRLFTGTISPLTYYVSNTVGASMNVPYTISAPTGSVSASNVITVELSNASGSFANPVVIGTTTSNTSGSVACTIPAGTPLGTGYRVRVKASSPAITAADNGTNITIANIAVTVAPNSSQSLLMNSPGTTLTATELPAGTAREWKYSTTQGGPYVSFSTPETNSTYDPIFPAAGTYYVVCESQILGGTFISNEVEINVSSFSLTTGTISGFPINLSASSSPVAIQVPFSTNGNLMNPGNVFTAQISDGNGSFANAIDIGTLAGLSDGVINATIPANMPSGDHYRIRVKGSDPNVFGANNGTDLVIYQFSAEITPNFSQSITLFSNGTPLNVSVNASNATLKWKYSTISGGPYADFIPLNTTNSYTPNFANPGTYYIVVEATNGLNDVVLSNEVEIIVAHGTSLITDSIDQNQFYVSPNAFIQTKVHFSADLVFNPGNVFYVEMSDGTGAFSTNDTVGSLTGTIPAPITITIPNTSADGANYRFRVLSSDPAIVGAVIPVSSTLWNFDVNTTPTLTQFLTQNSNGNILTVTSTHPNVYYQWQSSYEGTSYIDILGETTNQYTPNFAAVGQTDVRCKVTNQWNDVLYSNYVIIQVEKSVGLDEIANEKIVIYQVYNQLMVDLSATTVFENPQFSLTDMTGKVITTQHLQGSAQNVLPLDLASGVYVYRLIEHNHVITGKIIIQ